MLASYVIMRPEPIRSMEFGAISGAYSNIGTPLTDDSILLHFLNDTDADIMVSWFDGIDHMFFPPQSFFLLDIASNKGDGGTMMAPQYTQFQIKAIGALATFGSFYITSLSGYGGPR